MKKLNNSDIEKAAYKWVNNTPVDGRHRNAFSFYTGAKWAVEQLQTESLDHEADLLRFAGVVSGWEPEKLKNMWRTYKEKHGI